MTMPEDNDRASLSDASVAVLLGRYAAILAELRRRQVVRTDNAPVGDYAEWLVARALDGAVADNRSAKSWDIQLPDGDRIQVKARLVADPPRPGQLQTSPFRSWDFELAALVLLDSATYEVRRAVLLPSAAVQAAGSLRPHVNGTVLHMRPALMDSPDARDITEQLRAAAVEQSH